MEDTLSRLYGAADPVQTAMLDDVAMRAGVMPESGCRRVPLWDKSGDVAAWATVDSEDYAHIASFRWYRAPRGYAASGYRDGKHTRIRFMHREVLGLMYGDPRQADHCNRDKLDNRRSNLRICNQAENNQNVVGGRGKSGVHGVHWHSPSGRWMARVTLDGRMYWLGWHDTVEAAGEVVREWRKQNVPFSQEAMQ